MSFEKYPCLPRSVRLMNTGKELPFAVERLPGWYDGDTGRAKEYLHIRGIPVDDLPAEPIVLEVRWK